MVNATDLVSVIQTEIGYTVGCPALPGRRPSGSEDEVLQISMKLLEIFGGRNHSLNLGMEVHPRNRVAFG